MSSESLEQGFTLGDCVVKPRECVISTPHGEHRVEPRAMDVLVELARHPNQVVTREELIESIWGTTFVSDEVLSRCVSLLRKGLEDSAREPRYLETIPRRGYRLVASVAVLDTHAAEPTPSEAPSPESDGGMAEAVQQPPSRQSGLWAAAALMAVLAIASPFVWQWLAPSAAHKSVAVLAFENHSEDRELEYLSDGIAEGILNLLARVPNLKVVARTSAFAFKGQSMDVADVASQLSVDTLLQGNVSRTADMLRVRVQLIDAAGVQLFSDSYTLPLGDIFDIEDQVAVSTVEALRISELFEMDAVQAMSRKKPTSDAEAHLLYLQGNAFWNQRGAKAIHRSIELYREASTRDPHYAYPVLGIAKAYAVLPFYTGGADDESFALAQRAAGQALRLDPSLGEAHAVLAFTDMHQWQWQSAEREFRIARQLNPNDATTHQWYSQFLANVGFFDESLNSALIAQNLDPISPVVHERLATSYLWLNNDERASQHFAMASELGFDRSSIHEPTLLLMWREGRIDLIEEILVGMRQRLGLPEGWVKLVIAGLHDRGVFDQVMRDASALSDLDPTPSLMLFGAALLAGHSDLAYALVGQLVANRTLSVQLLFSPEADTFRRDPRFAALLQRIGLVDYWRRTTWPAACRETADTVTCD